MTKTLEQFKTDTLGGRFGVPGTSNTNLGDPAYAGQCVSYARLYMEEVLGIKTAAWGHAVNYWTNPSVLAHFDKVKTPQDGDIVVWGDDPGSWTTEYGHIAIWYKGQLLNQNYGGNLKVTINNMFTPGLLGYLRHKNKGGEEMIQDTDNEYGRWHKLGYQIRGRNLTRDEFRKSAVGRTWLTALEILSDSSESDAATRAQEIGRVAISDDWAGQIHGLVAQLQALPANTSDAEKKLNAIKDALGIK